MFNRVRVQLTALTVSIVVLLYAVSSLTVYVAVREIVIRTIDTRLNTVLVHAERRGWNRVGSTLPPGTFVILAGPNITLSNLPSDLSARVQALVRINGTTHEWRQNFRSKRLVYRIVLVPDTAVHPPAAPSYAVLVTDVARESSVLDRLRQVLILVGLCGLAIAALGGFALAERALRPIRRAWQQQLDFVADASHELRTPLAVIQSNLDVAMDHTEETILQNLEWLNNARSESRRLNRLVEDLLTLARSDSQATSIQKQRLALNDLLDHVVELFESIAIGQGIQLVRGRWDHVDVLGDRDRLHQLFVILLDNACKFTPVDGRIEVFVEASQRNVLVHVIDTGIGISEADLPHVFKRFYRADKARMREDASGTGLGLSIAKWIADAHGGKISISGQIGVGTTVTVQLPRA